MAEQDQASKTEQPTPKKLEKGRERGQVAVSQEVKSWAVLMGGALGILFLAPQIMRDVGKTMLVFLESPHAIDLDFATMQEALAGLVATLAIALAPFLGLVLMFGLAAGLAQVGWIWAPAKIKPEVKKISLVGGAKRLVSARSLVEFAKGIAKLTAVAVIASALVYPLVVDIELLPSIGFESTLGRLHAVALRLFAGTVAVMAVIAALDLLYQRHAFLKDMRMTKQEVKDEHKQAEGDPQIKARIRKLRMERAQQRMMAAVPKADVVITNPSHYAVALAYDMETMAAPKLVAKGVDHLARRIREVAEAHDVAVVENPPLARALYAAVDLDQEIPPEHYQAVAQVIGYVMRLKGRLA